MNDEPREPTLTISMSRKINLGNYESADCFASISGVRAGMSEEELAPLIETGRVAWEQVKAALLDGMKRVRTVKSEG